MLPLQEEALKKFWYPVIPASYLENQPCSFKLLGVPLVIWRDLQGKITTALDKCCHRSAKLSLGKVTSGGYLQCAYHGWQFDDMGHCCFIPQQPQEKIPPHFRLQTFPCQEKYGYVWVCLNETAIAPIPDFCQENDPQFRRFHGFYEQWNCAAIRYVENALDNSHHYFVHGNLLQTTSPIPNPIEIINETPTNFNFSIPLIFTNNSHLSETIQNQDITLTNQRLTDWYAPFGVRLTMQWPNGLSHHIVSFVVPKDNQSTQFIRFYFRNDVVSVKQDQSVVDFDRKLTNQDRRIMESIDYDSPLDTLSECSMAVDKPILLMRHKLAKLLSC